MNRRAAVVAALLAQLCLAGDCVDGVTPDCSDAASQCGPSLDGAVFDSTAPIDSSIETGGGDADPDADAGDQ